MGFIDKLKNLYGKFGTDTTFTVIFVLGVILFAFVYFFILKMMVSNRFGKIISVFVLSFLFAGSIVVLDSNVGGIFFIMFPILWLIIIVSLFAIEIKRLIWGGKRQKHSDTSGDNEVYDDSKAEKCIDEIIKALQDMSKNNVGAIMVLSNGNMPLQVIDSGVKMNCDISCGLIESVFFPKTPLHDGAMIFYGTKIIASGCFLPLPQNNDKIPKELGTRHRAGLGITETIDVVSIIVSEETGIISIAREGKFTRYATEETLRKILKEYYWSDLNSGKRR